MATPRVLPLLSAIALLFGVLALSSCSEEIGCTNRTADNYNPDAVRDDNSCINARDKFLGVYETLDICWPDSIPDIDSPQVRFFTIAEDDLREQNDDVIIYNFGRDNLNIRALVSRDKLIIPRQDLLAHNQYPYTFTGEGYIDSIGNIILRYNVVLMTTAQPIYEDCVILAKRQ